MRSGSTCTSLTIHALPFGVNAHPLYRHNGQLLSFKWLHELSLCGMDSSVPCHYDVA